MAEPPQIFGLAQVEAAIAAMPPAAVIAAMAEGFVAYSQGLVSVPPVQTLGQPPLANFVGHHSAQACIKSAYVNGGEVFVTKVASGGDGQNSGMVLVFSQRTYRPRALLLDEGLLTELRTAAAGALVARLFAPADLEEIAVIGCGVQALWQLRLLASVTPCRRVKVWARSRDKVEALAVELAPQGWKLEAAPDARTACERAGLVLTVTPARDALVQASWLQGRPVLVSAFGADAPGKQELDPKLVAGADLLVVDSLAQCCERGELQHALAAGLVAREKAVELGEWLHRAGGPQAPSLAAGDRPQLIVFDSTGVAVQDVKVAELAMQTLSGGGGGASSAASKL